MNIESRIRWLKAAAAITIGTGIMIAAAAIPALNAPAELLLDMIYFPVDGAQSMSGASARLFAAISGGVLAGWGLMAWLIVTELMPKDPALARRIILLSIGTWFVIDSSMSIAAGGALNLVGNVGFLLLFYLPVLKPVSGRGKLEAAAG